MARKSRSKTKLPKRIAGVKLPRALRKADVAELLASPAVHKALASALVAVTGAVAAKKAAENDDELRRLGADVEPKGRDKAHEAADLVAHALGEAVRTFAQTLRGDSAPAQPDGTAPSTAGEPSIGAAGSRKKPEPSTAPSFDPAAH